VRNFTLYTNAPKKALDDMSATLEAAGLTRAAILCLDNDA
jgi:hypothetical protein